MKAKELRIGNLVMAQIYRGVGLRITEVETISNCWVSISEEKNKYDYCINKEFRETGCEWGPGVAYQCFGIPLTEEWLLKFGFKDVQRGFFSIKAGSTFFRLTPPQFMGEWQTEYCWVYDDFKFTEVKYVHQLQNLYFALTGQELTLKNNQQ